MRITLTIDDDVHSLAKQLAVARGQTLGKVVSDLARHGLTLRHVDPTLAPFGDEGRGEVDPA